MRYWTLAALLVAAYLLQTAVLVYFKVGGIAPDLLLACTVSYGLLFGLPAGMGAGVLGGLLLDLLSGRYLGLHVLSLTLVGALAGWVEPRLFKDNLLLPVVAGVVGTLLAEGLVISILFLAARLAIAPWEMSLAEAFTGVLLPASAYNAIVTYLVYTRLHKHLPYLRPDPRGTIVLRR